MRSTGLWSLYNFFFAVQILAIAIPAVIASSLKIDIQHIPAWSRDTVVWAQKAAGWAVPIGALTVFLTKGICTAIGPPWTWRAVQRVLNEHRLVAFDVHDGDPVHHHRVTLFKRMRWEACLRPCTYWAWGWKRWPLDGWLIPVARSGHTTQRTDVIFMAPDDAENAEGVAGQTWACDQVLVINDLPDVSNDPTNENITDYAKRSFLSEDWVRKRMGKRQLSRSLCGIPLEVRGERWGVLILDSVRENAIKDKARPWDNYRTLVPVFLEQLLSRGGGR